MHVPNRQSPSLILWSALGVSALDVPHGAREDACAPR